jgi:hypothetical protein
MQRDYRLGHRVDAADMPCQILTPERQSGLQHDAGRTGSGSSSDQQSMEQVEPAEIVALGVAFSFARQAVQIGGGL